VFGHDVEARFDPEVGTPQLAAAMGAGSNDMSRFSAIEVNQLTELDT
jgi:hypothetical protein